MNYTYPSIVFCSLSLLVFTSHFYICSDYMPSLTAKHIQPLTHIRRIYSRGVSNDVAVCLVWHYCNTGRKNSVFSVPHIWSVALSDVNQTF